MEEIRQWDIQLRILCDNYVVSYKDYIESLLRGGTTEDSLEMKWILTNINFSMVHTIHFAVWRKIAEEEVNILEMLQRNAGNDEVLRSREILQHYQHFAEYALDYFQDIRTILERTYFGM